MAGFKGARELNNLNFQAENGYENGVHVDDEVDQFLEGLRQAIRKEKPADVNAYVHGFCKKRLSVTDMEPSEQAALLCDAAARGVASDLKWLLDEGVDPNLSDYDLRAPLHLAAEECQLECVELLLTFKADVNAADRWGTTPLGGLEALMQVKDDEKTLNFVMKVSKLLRESGAQVGEHFLNLEDTPTAQGHGHGHAPNNPVEALCKAAEDDDLATVERLLEGFSVTVTSLDDDGRTPLHHAAWGGNIDVVRFLVQKGSDVNATDKNGQTPTQRASTRSHFHIVSYLRDAGAVAKKEVEEPKSFEQYANLARKFWEVRLCNEADLPATADYVPKEVLCNILERDYGFDLQGHKILRSEIEQIASSNDMNLQVISRTAFMRAVLQGPIRKAGMVDPSSVPKCLRPTKGQPPNGGGAARPPSTDPTKPGDKNEADEHADLLSKIVLGELVIKSWASFTAILQKIFDTVFLDESLSEGPGAGKNADYIPELRDAPSDRLALAVCTIDGQLICFGDSDERYSIQSTGKSFAYTLAQRQHTKRWDPTHEGPEGAEFVHNYIGREPSGRAFNAFALTRPDKKGIQHPFNPVTNAGAIVACCMIDEKNELPLIPGDFRSARMESRVQKYKDFLYDLCGGIAEIGDCMSVFESEQKEAYTNYALANVMMAAGTFPPEVKNHESLREAVDFYLRMCSTSVNTKILAAIGATFATFGKCPMTGKIVTTMTEAKHTLAVLSSCGMYDFSGEWACTVGLPAKSGVSGNIFIVIPGMMGMCVWSPRLDALGNSVRGIRVAQMVKEHLSCSVLDLLSRAQET